MIGQDRILNQLLSALPDTTLLEGPSGCGKHLMVSEIAKHYNLPLIDITECIDDDYISEMHLRALPTLYLIDLDKLPEKKQNVALKCIEEPSETFKIILIASGREGILNTILNRCICLTFDKYKEEDLKKFIPESWSNKESLTSKELELVMSVVKTPGQIKNLTNLKVRDMIDLGNKIVTKLKTANFPNTLTISNKINYKDEYDKFDLEVFLDLIKMLLFEEYKNNSTDVVLNMYLITTTTISKLRDSRFNRELIFNNYLTTLWKEARK